MIFKGSDVQNKTKINIAEANFEFLLSTKNPSSSDFDIVMYIQKITSRINIWFTLWSKFPNKFCNINSTATKPINPWEYPVIVATLLMSIASLNNLLRANHITKLANNQENVPSNIPKKR